MGAFSSMPLSHGNLLQASNKINTFFKQRKKDPKICVIADTKINMSWAKYLVEEYNDLPMATNHDVIVVATMFPMNFFDIVDTWVATDDAKYVITIGESNDFLVDKTKWTKNHYEEFNSSCFPNERPCKLCIWSKNEVQEGQH